MRLHSLVIAFGLCLVGVVGSAAAGTLSLSSPLLPLGNQSVSGGATSGMVRVTNAGTDTTISSFDLTAGPTCAEFVVTTSAGITLTNAEFVDVVVEYDPVDRVADSCVITVNSDANDPTFTATGDGLAPALSVSGALTFGNVRWNTGASSMMDITITNNGEEAVTSSNLAATLVTGGQGFSIGTLPASIADSGGTGTLTITFDPASVGAKTDTVRITANNDPPGDGPFDVSVSGTGTQSSVTFTPSPLNIGNTPVGSTNTGTVAIGNNGLETLNITALSITGANASEFSFTDHGCSGQACSLGAPVVITSMGAAEDFVIRCAPTARGNRFATLSVTSDDPNPLNLLLACRGQSSEITVSPLSLTFNPTRVGSSDTTRQFTVSNLAQTSPATILNLTYDVTEALADYAITCSPACSGTLTPGNSATVTVTFTPTTTGPLTGNIVVTSNDPDEPSTNVAVSGSGTQSQIAAAPNPLAFGPVPVAGTGTVLNVVLTNNGTASLNTTTMTISGAAAFSFGFSSGLCQSGQTCTRVVTAPSGGGTANVPIRCNPATQGAKTGTLSIGSDAPGADPDVTVSLTCTGTVSVMTVAPTSLTFATPQRVNTNSTAQTFTIGNAAGLAPLNYQVTRPTTDFLVSVGATSCTPTCTGQVAAGGSATVSVRFRPATSGAKSGNVLVDDTDNFTTDVMVAVSGTGVEPLVALTAPTPPTPPSTGGSLTFGNVPNNTTSPTQTITIQNTGSMDLSVTNVTNTNAANFNLTGPSTATIAMGMSQSWTVACDPETRGPKTGTIQIANDSTNDTSVDVALSCTSIEGFLVATSATPVPISSGTIDFGPVFLNTMVMTTVTVQNQGNVAATIASITIAPTDQGFTLTGFTPNTTVNAGNSTTFTVTFLPTLDAQGTATLTIDSEWNDPTLNLTGDGQPTGVAVTPNPAALGNVAWDSTLDQTITVQNVATGTFRLDSATLTGADAGEFQIVGFTAGNITAGGMRQFTLRANPSDTMLGARSATLVVTTNLPVGMGDVTNVPISYTSVGPAVSLSPGMTVDFGGVDVDVAGGSTMALTITNSGTGTMDITNVSGLTAPFTKTALASTTIPAGMSQTIMITYQPTTERASTNPETQSFTVTTDGLYANGNQQPASFQVAVRGYGIDRHISVTGVVFPDTYRNPTAAQIPRTTCGVGSDQACAVRVCNTGGATLDVTMITDPTDSFELQSTTPFTVGAGTTTTPTCMDMAVDFMPPSYGTFNGTVTLVNNDNAMTMAMASMSGKGVARPVAVMPGSVPSAVVARGAPVKLSELSPGGLVLQNPSTTESFSVHAEVTGTGATLVGNDVTLAPGATATYDVEIVADTAGAQDVVIDIRLDDDPADPPHHQLTLSLDVVDVDVHGGGCDSGAGGAGLMVGLLGLGLLVHRRRRWAALAAAALAAGAGGGTARADVSRNFDASNFSTSPGTEPGMFTVDSPDVAAKGAWALLIGVSHAMRPLVAEWTDSGMNDQTLELISARTTVDVGLAYALTDKIELALAMPLYQQSGETPQMDDPRGLTPADGFALGDAAVRVKAQVKRGKVGFAGSLAVTAPTATDGQFTGVDLPTAHLEGLLGVRGRRMSAAFNLGFLARRSSRFTTLEQGSDVTYGAALSFRVLDKVALVGEAHGSVGVVGAEGKVSPLELAAGVRFRANRALVIGVGGGGGFGQGIGVPDARGFLTLAIAPRARPIDPLKVVVPPPPRDIGDDDNDGVVNADDLCPLDAEDNDDFEDADGCPEKDNDRDGLLDGVDTCPDEPEDKDGFEDEDGCIDGDNDGDGILDIVDKCPLEPEDKDGFQDEDGCDEPDNDQDGIPDILDQCALEPETINGVDDEDGCPDQGESLVMLMQDRIEVLEPITFVGKTSKLGKNVPKVLAQVGATMRADRSLKRVRITVHVHPRGRGDQALSDKRAEEIRRWLLQWGVEPERIEAKGIGSQRPLVPKRQRGAAKINDRVEFIILERN